MLAVAALLLFSQRFERAPLQPYEVRSLSGEWTFEVRPSQPYGKGPMHARILRNGEARWSGDFPWTFEQAGVSDDGTCVGYANGTKLLIGLLDPQGALRKQHEIEHTAFLVDGPALPEASGPVLVHPTADLALIRVLPADQARPAPWRAFRLSTGEASADVVPAQPLQPGQHQGIYEGDARVIGDTGLTLVHWWFTDYARADLDWPKEGGVFALHDLQGKTVWTLALLDDYTDRTSEEADDRLENEVRRTGVIVSAGPGNRYVLRHVRENARVEYEVEEDAGSGGWSVKELSRGPWHADEPAQAALAVEPIELVRKGTAALRPGAAPRHPIHGVIDLGFTEQGEIELLRREEEGGQSYARLRTNGELVFERDLSSLEKEGSWHLFHELSGDRWLVQFVGGEPSWMELDVRTGSTKVSPLPEAELGCHVAPCADGGYLALLSRNVRYTAFNELYYVRADGTVGWQHGVTGLGPDETELDRAVYFGQGIARTGDTTFTLLSMDALTRIDLDRNVLGRWELEDVLGHDPGYMDGLLSDGKGGVLFEAGGAFQQVDSFGTRTGSFAPRCSDGSSAGRLLRVAPDGRMWTSDGQRVYRLDEAGVADMVLGPEMKDDELAESDGAMVDALGRALVQDKASRAVHAFDADGRRLALCRLEPAERPVGYVGDPFGGDRDGSIWVKMRNGVARFDATGRRIEGAPGAEVGGRRKLGQRPRTEDEAERKALSQIKTRPDGKWLANAKARAVLPDGRRAILESPEEEGRTASLHFYTAANEPLHTLALPANTGRFQLSPGARWIVVGDFGPSWTLLRLADERLFRFEPALEDGRNWYIGQTPEGRTLLLLNARRLELVQYELP